MNQIDISIIVPIYNVELYLEKCINSILNQTFKNFELLLVNDGSTDNSGEICDKYARVDNRIKVIHKENGGLSSARNEGLKNALGEYFAFVDSDDYIDYRMYETLFGLIKENQADISICNFIRQYNGKIEYKEDTYIMNIFNTEEALQEMFKGNLYRFSVCNKLFHKRCFSGVIFPEGRIHEDLSTSYRLFSNAKKVVYTNFPGYIYVKREESILTSSYSEKRLQAFIGWDEIIEYISKRHPVVMNRAYECYVYTCLNHISEIIIQVNDDIKKIRFLDFIRKKQIKYLKYIMFNVELNFKIKLHIIIFIISPQLYLKIFKKRVAL